MRKKARIIIDETGKRDAGKIYELTEMPAVQAEKFAIKIFLALAHAGVQIPENIVEMGIKGLLLIGLDAVKGLAFYELEPILDEMMPFVVIAPDPQHTEVTRTLVSDDIEEIATRLKIRKELLKLNLDFFEDAIA